jgi:uncharacterized protein
MRLTLFLDHACNLRCTYCYNGQKFSRPMPRDVARRALDVALDACRGPDLVVALFGGEPLLDLGLVRDVVALAREAAGQRGKPLRFHVTTNGTLLDDERVALLRENDFTAQVSLDGCREAHDATRRFADGSPSHHVVVENTRRLMAAGVRVRVVSVMDPANVAHLADSLDFLADLGVRHLHFAPNVLGHWDDDACSRMEQGLRALGDRYMERLRRGMDLRLDPLHGKMVTHLATEECRSVRCAFGQDELAVAPSGRLYPCDRMVRADSDDDACMGDVWSGVDAVRLERLLAPRRTLDAECAACDLRDRCTHWCGCANWETTRNPGRPSALQCWLERAFVAEADRVAATLYGEKNPLFMTRFYEAPLVRIGRRGA